MRFLSIPKKLTLLLLALSLDVAAFAPTNFFNAYDSALRFPKVHKRKHCHKSFELGIIDLEFGSRTTGRNWQGHRRNVLQLHDDTQRAVSMLSNPVNPNVITATQPARLFISNVLGLDPDQVDADLRIGNKLFTGKVKELDVDLYAKYMLPFECIPGKLGFALYLPVIHKNVYSFDSVDLTDQSDNQLGFTGVQLAQLRQLITGDLVAKAQTFGDLNLSDWKKTSVGDFVAMLEWCFGQKPSDCRWVNFGMFAKAGVSFPTGHKKDENRPFSMAIGNDGAWGIPLGLSVSACFGKMASIGLDSELLVLFDKTRVRRLKTDVAQTEFLLLNKGKAKKEYGVTWQLHPYIHFHPWTKRCALHLGYQFVRHEKDKLKVKDSNFDNAIVNTAHSLYAWDVHNIITRATWQFCSAFNAGIFYKHGISGKNIINMNTIGLQGCVRF